MYEDDEPMRGRDDWGEDADRDGVTRVHRRPRTGTKVTAILAAALLVVAVYVFLAPVYMETANGWFRCGSALRPPTDDFTKNVCSGAPSANRAKAMLAVALAVVVGGLGAWLFGFDVEREVRDEVPRGGESRRARRSSVWDD